MQPDYPTKTNPSLKDLTSDTITPHAILLNSSSPNPRLNTILTALITHLHAFAQETNLTTTEWQTAISFLTTTGQTCSSVRQEFILLSDILGLSTLVTNLAHPKPPGATESSILGPFHTHHAQETTLGDSIASPGKGEPCLFLCTVRDLHGMAIAGAKIDVWEADATGHYDTQYGSGDVPDYRGVLTSTADGRFWFKCIKPPPYPIPGDGPVGELLNALGRHPFRPGHVHFLITAPGYDTLVTALYVKGDPYEMSDAVFGVKSSLVVEFKKIEDEAVLREYGLEKGAWRVQYDFVMVGEKEVELLRGGKAEEAEEWGRHRRAELVEGLLALDVVD